MNDRDPFFLLTLSALEAPPLAFPQPDEPEPAPEPDEDALLVRLRAALHRRGYELP